MCFMKPPKIEQAPPPPPPPPPLPEEVKGIKVGGSEDDSESGVDSLVVKPKPFKKDTKKQLTNTPKLSKEVTKANV